MRYVIQYTTEPINYLIISPMGGMVLLRLTLLPPSVCVSSLWAHGLPLRVQRLELVAPSDIKPIQSCRLRRVLAASETAHESKP